MAVWHVILKKIILFLKKFEQITDVGKLQYRYTLMLYKLYLFLFLKYTDHYLAEVHWATWLLFWTTL